MYIIIRTSFADYQGYDPPKILDCFASKTAALRKYPEARDLNDSDAHYKESINTFIYEIPSVKEGYAKS